MGHIHQRLQSNSHAVKKQPIRTSWWFLTNSFECSLCLFCNFLRSARATFLHLSTRWSMSPQHIDPVLKEFNNNYWLFILIIRLLIVNTWIFYIQSAISVLTMSYFGSSRCISRIQMIILYTKNYIINIQTLRMPVEGWLTRTNAKG